MSAEERDWTCAEDVKYLLDVSYWGQTHLHGWPVNKMESGECECRLGILRRKYDHWPENGRPVTKEEWERQREPKRGG